MPQKETRLSTRLMEAPELPEPAPADCRVPLQGVYRPGNAHREPGRTHRSGLALANRGAPGMIRTCDLLVRSHRQTKNQ